MQTFSNITINSLREISFIAGSYKELYFHAFTSASASIDLTYCTAVWSLCPYDKQDFIAFHKHGFCENGFFTIYLTSIDTKFLSGKFIQKPTLIVSTGYEYRLGQGVVNIIPAITSGSSPYSTYFPTGA